MCQQPESTVTYITLYITPRVHLLFTLDYTHTNLTTYILVTSNTELQDFEFKYFNYIHTLVTSEIVISDAG